MKWLRDALANNRGELLGIAGAAAVSAGAGMVYVPAGVMTAGGFLLFAAYLDAWSSLELPWMKKRNVA